MGVFFLLIADVECYGQFAQISDDFGIEGQQRA
jgi:hypothetical protein